jgi:DNA-binding NtrC family response regulator
MLCRAGYNVDTAHSEDEASTCLNESIYHIILTDIDGSSNLEILKTIKRKAVNSEIIVLASYGNMDVMVNSIKVGAFDCLVKPIEDKKILASIERALVNKPLEKFQNIVLKKACPKENAFHDIVGKSSKLNEIYSLVERIASSRATVLIRGESGTGKRLIAHSIHKADKRRKHRAFVEVSCGALPREIIESELFGHTKGAFTGAISERKGRFELANGGTIMLDDIDSLALDLQVKLLRVLQQKEFERVGDHRTTKVDVRVVATTNQDLEKLVAEKKFREDLFYRLNVILIDVPALREIKEDLPPLVYHFINLYAKENHKKIKAISKEMLDILTNYNWPGNTRQLENIIERAVILDTDGVINADDLPELLIQRSQTVVVGSDGVNNKSINHLLKDALKHPEKLHILKVLEEVAWNKKKAARKLGVNRTTLYNKLRKYNLFSDKIEK